MLRIRMMALLVILSTVVYMAPGYAAKTKLTLVTHWGAGQKEYIDAYVAEYMQQHPDVEITHLATASGDVAEYLQKIQVMHAAGTIPDIIHIYSPWSVTLRDAGMLARVPADVVSDVTKNYVPAAVEGATLDGILWGIPTEINDYALVYNARLLSEAGLSVPQTWDELVRVGKHLTVVKPDGSLLRAGFAFINGWPEAVVHPFLSMLFAEGGRLFTSDKTKSLLDSPAALNTLQKQVRMFEEGATTKAAAIWNFASGGTATMIMAPWYEKSLRTGMKDSFVDVAATVLPPGSAGRASILYNWGFAVDQASAHQRAAWDFLLWLTKERDGKRNSRMGDYLTDQGILPSRWNDIQSHPDQLMDAYTKAFVESLNFCVSEPVAYRSAEINSIIMKQVNSAWYGEKSAQNALSEATRQIDVILAQYYKKN